MLYHVLRSTSEDPVPVDAVPLTVHFTALIVFKEYKKVILKLLQPVRYHTVMSSVAKHPCCLSCSFYKRV